MLTALLLSALLLVPASGGTGTGCSDSVLVTGGCGVDNNGTEIVIDGSHDTEQNPGTSPVNDWQPPLDDAWTPPTPEEELDECLREWDSYIRCYEASKETEGEEAEEEPAIPAITITDLARFAPAGSTVTGEPDNVGVAGLPTNFVTTASVQTVTGDLFGFPVSVRFTPSAYDFSFGDGATTTTTSGGTTWADLDQAQFTPTETSHTYRDRGSYIARVDVRYTAEVDFGIGWFPVSGEVTSTGAEQEVRIFEAHTALVAHTCAQAPSSPGC
ncbi:hypothetical protein [Microbacterium abyssi]|uniref:hypothetical protein n=1 Tax=Microbacterium abyssi TaxID=2782166 RepID=UPI0018899905|nr:hypothetical protein [Microbacterium sp. A18JL241]